MNKNVGISYKALGLLLAVVLVLGGAIGGTMAWLIDDTTAVTNVFMDSDVDIEFNETTEDYKMIPGHTIDKDPTVTVNANSEKCYLFVKIDESENYSKYLKYAVKIDGDKEWRTFEDADKNTVKGVYYRIVEKSESKQTFSILGSGSYDNGTDGSFFWSDNQVLVKPEVTKKMMNDIKGNTESKPTLTFTTYAVQFMKNNKTSFTVAEAWEKAKGNEVNATNN